MEAQAQARAVNPGAGEPPALVRDLLRKRGLIDAAGIRSFLWPQYENNLGDPFLLSDMDKAVARIIKATKDLEKVAVYGDYDIDGIASTTLMLETLQRLGLEPLSYIPDRYDEGYGIHVKALEQLAKEGVTLVVSVDCGITSIEEAAWAREHNLDLIITDHHEVPAAIPEAVAVINPHRPGDKYPFKELSGSGVAFAVARALQQRTSIPEAGREKWLLDLVALGTVCDVMPLVGENRTLVYFGLLVLRKTRRVGLVALAQSAGLELAETRAYHLGFVFGPRLNAAGRLEHANFSLELMTTKDPIDAQALAFQLEELNHQRRLEQDRIFAEADAAAEGLSAEPVLVLADPGWSHGVVGIVASKLAEKWQKPTLVLQILGDDAKGSGRSAGGYNLIDGLQASGELFTRLGGHHFAAGFTLPAANLPDLQAGLTEHYRSVATDLTATSARQADIEVDDLAELDWGVYNALELFEPCGNGNPQPVFGLTRLKVVAADTVGKDRRHLKLKLASPAGAIYEGIGFNLAEKSPNLKIGQQVDVLCYLQKNQWQDRTTLQLVLITVQ